YIDPDMITASGTKKVPGYATDIITEMSLDWLQNQNKDQPFCLLVHHKAPHRPWVPHPRHADMYPAGSIPEPETLFDDHSTRSKAVQQVRMSIADDLTAVDLKEETPEELRGPEKVRERASWNYQRYMRDYLQTVQAIDDGVGRILDYLEEEGLAEEDRKSTRLNSSHVSISYAVFCLNKK